MSLSPARKPRGLIQHDSFTLYFPEPARGEPSLSYLAAPPSACVSLGRPFPCLPSPATLLLSQECTEHLSLLSKTLWIPRGAETFWEPHEQHADQNAAGQLHLQNIFFLKCVPERFSQSPNEVWYAIYFLRKDTITIGCWHFSTSKLEAELEFKTL